MIDRPLTLAEQLARNTATRDGDYAKQVAKAQEQKTTSQGEAKGNDKETAQNEAQERAKTEDMLARLNTTIGITGTMVDSTLHGFQTQMYRQKMEQVAKSPIMQGAVAKGVASGEARVGTTTPEEGGEYAPYTMGGYMEGSVLPDIEDSKAENIGKLDYRPAKSVVVKVDEQAQQKDNYETIVNANYDALAPEYGVQNDMSYGERIIRTTYRLIDSMPKDENGNIIVNGIPYTQKEITQMMAPEVANTLAPKLWRDEQYREDWAKKAGYENFDTFLTEIDQKLEALDNEIVSDTINESDYAIASAGSEAAAGVILGKMLAAEAEGRKSIRDARDQIAAMRNPTFWTGTAEGGDLLNALTFNISGLISDARILAILNKAKDGEALTPSEMRIFEIAKLQDEISSLDESLGGATGWRAIGQGVARSAEVAGSMALGMGVGSLVPFFAPVSIGAKVGIRATRRAFNRSFAEGVKKGAEQMMRVGGRGLLNLLKHEGAGAVGSLAMPSTYSNYIQNRTEQFSFENGKLVYKPTKAWEDVYNTLVDQANELASERMGAGLSDILTGTFKAFGRALGVDKVVNWATEKIGFGADYEKLFGWKKPDLFKAFERRVGFSGLASEPASEVLGDILSNLMKMAVTGDGNLDMLKSAEYWRTTFMVSTIYGGSLQILSMPSRYEYYRTIYNTGQRKAKALRNINNKELADNLRMLSTQKNLASAAQTFASLDWGSGPVTTDILNAMDYIRAEAEQQVAMGVNEENARLIQFGAIANAIEADVYRGVDGNDIGRILQYAKMEDGSMLPIISGDISKDNMEGLLMIRDKDGNITPVSRSKVSSILPVNPVALIASKYKQMFEVESQIETINEMQRVYESLEAPSKEKVARMMAELGIKLPEVGDEMSLVDGRVVVYNGMNEDGTINAYTFENEGNIDEMLVIPFHQILSSSSDIANAQQIRAAEQGLDTTERAMEAEALEEDIAEAEGGNMTSVSENAPQEAVTVDDVTAAQNEVEGIAQVPVNEDGSVNYDAIDDPNVFATEYVRERGDKEKAIAEITELRNAVEAKMQDSIEKGKKMTSANEKIANRKEREALAERMAFYDSVLNELAPKETPAEEEQEVNETANTNVEDSSGDKRIEGVPTMPEATVFEVGDEVVHNGRRAVVDARNADGTYQIDYNMSNSVSTQGKDIDVVDGASLTKAEPTAEEETEFGIVDNAASRQIQDDTYNAVNKLAKAFGLVVEFRPVAIDTEGRVVNGFITDDGRVIIATKYADKSINFLTGHEFLHRMKDLAPEQYEKFVKSVKAYLGQEEWNRRVEEMKSRYVANKMDKKAQDDALMTEECVADFMGEMVEENGAFDKYLDTIKEDRPILNAIKRVLKYIADLFNGENRRINEMLKQVDALIMAAEKAWANAPAADAVSTNKNGKVTSVTNEKTGSGRFSLMTYEEGGRDALASFLASRIADNALTEAEAQQMMSDMERVYEICNELKDKYAPFGAWSEAKVEVDKNGNPVFSVIKSNGDYAMNLDFSLVCKKRRTLDAVLNEMIKRGMINTLPDDPKEIAKINDVIRKYGFETACRLCFVDAKRFRVLEVANDFANMYNDMVDMLIPKGKKIAVNKFSYAIATEVVEGGLETISDDALNLKSLEKIGNKMKKNEKGEMVLDQSVPARIARHLLANPQDRRHVQASDFVSTLGFDNVKAQNPNLLSLYNSKKGSGGPKASFSDVQYLNDILTKKWNPEAAYAVGGVRLQSFSDYVPRMVFDYIQMVADLAAKGLPVHAYTKEELFAKTFGLTGIKINLSLVPKVVEGGVAAGLDAEGNYAWQEGETFPYDVAVEIQNAEGYRENCGTIAVGVSDEQIFKMLDDPNIRMIIPYHKSGLAKKVAIHNNIAAFKDYTNVQNTRKGGKKVEGKKALEGMPNFNEEVRKTNDPRAAATAYLDWCKSKGYTPKFDKFASHPNYYKLLEDFTTLVDETYVPQEAVKFVFPTEESAFGSLETLIEQGLEEDAILEGQRDAKVGAIVDELQDKRYSVMDEETAYSNVRYSITETDPTILDALNNGETIKVYRAMQVIDGELYPPMSAKVDGKLRNPIKIGVWERAEERPDLADEKGNFKLDKGNKTSLKARYNPYIHTSLTPLNDQFSSAQDRPNLVTVEVEVPVSELTSGYKAEKAKDAVGKLEWKAGVVQGQLTGTRTVILSRWDRPIRIVPDSEVAQRIVEMFGDTKVVMPSNVVTPSLRAELEKLGVPFKETTNQGKPKWAEDIQGNPIDEEGQLVVEEVASVDGITDADFTTPYRNVKLPPIARNLAEAIGLKGKDVIIKKNIFEKNRDSHKDIGPQESRKILKEVLWGTNLYGRNLPKTRPFNWILIHLADKNSTVLVEIDNKKDNAEIVNWHYLDHVGLEQKKRQAEKEGGLILALASAAGNTLNDLSSANKDTTSSAENQTNEQKFSLITPEMDAAYLSAVERGEMDTAQQMVMEAAKLAMPNTKVVDENGNPKVMYHGTDHGLWTKLDTSKSDDGLSFFMTSDIRVARTYEKRSEYPPATWLPMHKDAGWQLDSGVWSRRIEDFVQDGYEISEEQIKDYYDGKDVIIRRPPEKAVDTKKIFKFFVNAEHPLIVENETAKDWRDLTVAGEIMSTRGVSAYAKDNGYDAAYIKNIYDMGPSGGWDDYYAADDLIIYHPNQIKSAEPVTYDDNGNVIPLSERFNPEKEDIRYSLMDQETIDNALSNFRLTKDNVNDFCYALMQMLTGKVFYDYGIVGDMEIRIKDHTPDWDNFLDFDTEEPKYPKILNVTVGDYNNTDYRRNKREAEEFADLHPDTVVVDVEIEDGAYLEDAVEKIHSALKEKGIDFEATPLYEWVEIYSEEKNDLSNLRYSLSDRPTGLLTDFAEEFEALQKMYESLDPTTIHSQHPFRIQKRKVVQKYLNHVSEVLGLPCEVFVLDSSNEQQMRTAYRKYVASRQANGKASAGSYEEFKKEISDAIGEFFYGTNMVVINIDAQDLINVNSEYLGAVLHENAHKIIEGMGVDEKVLEAIYEEVQKLADKQSTRIDNLYGDRGIAERGEEIITFALQTRATFTKTKDLLMQFFEGKVSEDDILKSFNISLPLRDRILKDILIDLRDGYNNKHNNEYAYNNGGTKEEASGNRFRSEHLRPSTRGGLLDEARFSIPDMPFFEDNGDIVTFEDMTPEERKATQYEEAVRMTEDGNDAQTILDTTGWVNTEDGWEYFGEADIALSEDRAELLRVSRWLQSKAAIKKNGIRKMYDSLIKEQKRAIADIEARQSEHYPSKGTNRQKVDYILQGQAPESLPIEDQVLVDIALGQRLKWNDGHNKRGLKTELGLDNARAEMMGAVTIGAKDYLEDYVEALMERNNGYENGIDDNDIRNAVIEMFRSFASPRMAVDELYARYRTTSALTEAEEGLYRLEHERDAALAEVESDLRSTMASFEDNPTPYIRDYNESEAWQNEIGLYTNSLRKAKEAIERMRQSRAADAASRKSKAEAVRNLKAFISNMLRGDLSRYTHKRDILALMNAVNESTTVYQMLRAVNKAMESAYNVRLRKEVARMNNLSKMRIVLNETNLDPQTFLNNMVKSGKMTLGKARQILNNYWKGVNASGISIAQGVDGDTAEIMQFIRYNIDMTNLNGVTIEDKCKKLRDNIEEDKSMSEEFKAKKLAAVDIIEEYLFLQQMMAALREINGGEKSIEETIAHKATEIAKLNNELRTLEAKGEALLETDRGYKTRKKAIEEKLNALRNEYSTALVEQEQAYASYYGSMPDIIERLYQANNSLEEILKTGKIALSQWKQAETDHRNELIRMALDDINRPEALQGTVEHSKAQKLRDSNVGRLVTAHLNTFDHLLRRAGENAPNGEGKLWRYFVEKLTSAYNRLFDEQQACADMMNAKCRELFGKDFNKMMSKAENTVIGYRLENVSGVDKGKKDLPRKDQGVVRVKKKEVTIAQALNIIATWNQADGRKALEKQGYSDAIINDLITNLNADNPKWMAFEEWVVGVFLPSRREKYNAVYRSMFGVNMDNVVNYFPIRRDTKALVETVDLSSPNFTNLPSTITGSIIKRTGSSANIDLENSFFEVLRDHIVDMEKWAEIAPITKDLNTLLSSGVVKTIMNAKGEHFFDDFKEAAKIATLNFTGNSPEYDKIFWPIINRMWASSHLAFKPYTALKQLASSVLFAQYADNPLFVGRLLYYYMGGTIPLPDSVFLRIGSGKMQVNPQGGWHWNIQWAKENSAMFRERAEAMNAGNDVFAKEIDYKTTVGKTIGEAIEYLTQIGMSPIAFVDLYTSAAGMRAVYDITYKQLVDKGASHEEAHKEAIFRAELAVNKTQQSSQFIHLAPMQVTRGAGSMLSTFNNAPFAQGRMLAEAVTELSRDKQEELRTIIEQEEEWLKSHRFKNAYREVEDKIAEEKALGLITTPEEETERRKELQRPLNMSVRTKAQRKAPKIQRGHRGRAWMSLALNAYIGQFAFNVMAVLPYMMFGDDDEKKKDLLKSVALWSLAGPLGTMPVGSALISALQGFSFEPLGAYGSFVTDVEKLIKSAREDGFNIDFALTAIDIVARKGLGVDYHTFYNVYAGIENLVEDGYSKEAVMMMINTPKSQVKLLAGERREGETAEQYTTRIIRLFCILNDPEYTELYSGTKYVGGKLAGMSITELRQMHAQYEEAFRRDVVLRKGDKDLLSRMDDVEEEYNKAMKAMGWKKNANPNKAAFESGKYMAPVEGITASEYRSLSAQAKQVARCRKTSEKFIGSDNTYYIYLKDEIRSKEKFIEQFNKATSNK